MVGHDAVEEEQPLEMIQLVLHGTGLEGVHLETPRLAVHVEPLDDKARRPAHVAGQVGDAHAPLTADLDPRSLDDDRIEQHHLAMTRARLAMAGDVDAERPSGDADLRGGDTHRVPDSAHGVEQIASERPSLVADVADGLAAHRQGRMRKLEDPLDHEWRRRIGRVPRLELQDVGVVGFEVGFDAHLAGELRQLHAQPVDVGMAG
jgi:hypothetical protein